MDKYQRLQSVGVPGELCITGIQMARGYLNRPELTAKSFKQNSFQTSELNAVIYHTGDLACWLPDGNLKSLGRLDQQVKIRGCRIELAEIEQKILQFNKVQKAAVLDFAKGGDKYLAAYIVPLQAGEEINIAVLRCLLVE